MNKLKLDVHTWKSGGCGYCRTGLGVTFLKNNQGFMCCLGQFAKQLGVKDECLLGVAILKDLSVNIPDLLNNTRWCDEAIDINDIENTSVKERIKNLKKHCKKNDIELTLVNNSAFRKDGSINWKFVASTFTHCYGNMTSHEIEQHNKYCRQAIRKVGKKKFIENIERFR